MREIRFAPRHFGVIATAVLVAACSGGSPSPTATPATQASLQLPPGFPIGTWTTTITADDLRVVDRSELAKMGMSEDALVKENSGIFTTTFAADGTWSTVQKSDQPVKWPVFRGTFTPVGTDAMDQTTTFPPDFAGDVVRFKWRVQDGQLYLAVPNPPDPIMEVVTQAHPWARGG